MPEKERNPARPVKIGITGPPAAGKSTVLKLFQEAGFPTFSADAVVRELSRPCRPGYHQLCARFGSRFLRADGALDRRALLRALLEEPPVKRALEEIFHPLVKERLLAWFREHGGAPLLAAEIPLLYQAGWADLFDEIIFVTCPREALEARLLERLQEPVLARQLLQCYCIQPQGTRIINNLDFRETRRQIDNLIQALLAQRVS